MRKSRIILVLIYAVFLVLYTRQAAHADREGDVCTSVNHCVVILENHAPDSFDYHVLRDEFLRYGIRGKDALMLMVSSGDKELEARALQILFRGPFRFSPADQRKLIKIWPSVDRTGHARVLKKVMSPLVRSAAIDTLSHDDAEVRRHSRALLADAAAIDFPMRGQDYTLLARAVLDEPTPGLVKLLGKFPAPKTAPVFARVLRSGNAQSVAAAYEELYENNKETAFKTLVGVISDLKDNELPAALAISDVLQQRHENRKDGFYLKFARDLSGDGGVGHAGRAVGYDALIRSQANTAQTTLSDSDIGNANFKYILEQGKFNVLPYVKYLEFLNPDNADAYIAALDNYFQKNSKTDPPENHFEMFITSLGNFDTPLAKQLVKENLYDTEDFNIISAAIISASRQNQQALKPEIQTLSQSHPITRVRIAALLALEEFQSPENKTGSEKLARDSYRDYKNIVRLNKAQTYCRVKSTDFKSLSKGMPYFAPIKIDSGFMIGRRGSQSTAVQLKSGWLAGYDFGEFGGGLVYYGYDPDTSSPLMDENVIAIVPLKKLPLGQFSTSFWVVTGLSHLGLSYGNVYKVTLLPEKFTVKRHAALPGPARSLTVNSDNSLSLDFVDYQHIKRNSHMDIPKEQYNPPLLLEPNGAIRRLCENNAPTTTDATP